MKSLSEVVEWRDSRQSPDWPLSHFSEAIGASTKVMRIVEFAPMSDDKLREKARGDHVISLVSATETFFRDVVALLCQDSECKQRVAKQQSRKKMSMSDLVEMESYNLTTSEMIAADMNFQDVSTINSVMSTCLGTQRFLGDIGAFDTPVIVGGQGLRPLTWPDNWEAQFARIFEVRHNLVHNKHYSCALGFQDMRGLEELVNQVAHVAWWLVAKRLNAKLMTGRIEGVDGFHPSIWQVEWSITAGFWLESVPSDSPNTAPREPNHPKRNRKRRRADASRSRREGKRATQRETPESPVRYSVHSWDALEEPSNEPVDDDEPPLTT